MEPIRIEVFAYAPTVFFHCQHCELTLNQMGIGERIQREQAREALPEDLRSDFEDISDWIHGLVHRHGMSVNVRVVDVASVEGVLKALKYRLRRFPAAVVGGKDKFVGADLRAADPVIESRLEEAARAAVEEVTDGI